MPETTITKQEALLQNPVLMKSVDMLARFNEAILDNPKLFDMYHNLSFDPQAIADELLALQTSTTAVIAGGTKALYPEWCEMFGLEASVNRRAFTPLSFSKICSDNDIDGQLIAHST